MKKIGQYYLFAGMILAILFSSCSSKKPTTKTYIIPKKDKTYVIIKKEDQTRVKVIKNSENTPVPKEPVVIKSDEAVHIDKEDEGILYEEFINLGLRVPKYSDIEKYLYFYGVKNRTWTEAALNRANLYMPMIKSIFRQYGLPEELAYLPVVESGYDPFATSYSGAAGIWQFIRTTGRRFGLRINRYVDERRDPYKSTIAAAKYLKHLYGIFKRWDLVLAAYNCGEGCVLRRMEHPFNNFWEIKYDLPDQTQKYVPKFLAVVLIAKNPEKYGIKIRKTNVYYVKTQKTPITASLNYIARNLRIDYKLLKKYNAHFRRNVAVRGYNLNIPYKTLAQKKLFLKRVSYIKKKRYRYHRVKKGDTLYRISKKYGVSIEKIKKLNKIKGSLIKPGMVLKIPLKEVSYRR